MRERRIQVVLLAISLMMTPNALAWNESSSPGVLYTFESVLIEPRSM